MTLLSRINRALRTVHHPKRRAALREGIKTEMEHSKTITWARRNKKATVADVAKRIASDHLREDPAYYGKLAVMEAKAKKHPKLKSPRLKLLGRRGKLKIYRVDATKVRMLTHLNPNAPDFTMGTGDQVWKETTGPWQIWVSNELDPFEAQLTMLHEMTERRLMLRHGLSYDDAHDKALAIEDKYRKANGRGLKQALARERGQ